MVRISYVNISIPETLVKDIDEIVDRKLNGYTSRAEFVKHAIRELLEKTAKNWPKARD